MDEVKYSDFINRELILFSRADLQRSIPSLLDGLKPGQRKIMFSVFKRKLRNDIKVAQLAGYVSEHSAYHHGEASLMTTIVGLAQVSASYWPAILLSCPHGCARPIRRQSNNETISAYFGLKGGPVSQRK